MTVKECNKCETQFKPDEHKYIHSLRIPKYETGTFYGGDRFTYIEVDWCDGCLKEFSWYFCTNKMVRNGK